jgi:hypothetical protein
MGDDAGTRGRDPAPVPDLGFFPGPPSSGGSQPFGSAPPGPSSPMAQAGIAPEANRFGGPAVGSVLPAPRTAAEPERSQLPRSTVALLVGACALVVLGVVGGVVFAARGQDVAERTTIAMPAQAGAFTKVGTGSPDNPSAFLTDNAKLTEVQAGVYQRGAVHAAVVGAPAKGALTLPDQQQVMAAFSAAIEERTGFPTVLAPVHTPLVGIFGCSQVEQENTVSTACLSTSPGAVVAIVIVGEDYQVATKDARTLLEVVESQG